jgi:outer membrane scaffolding protein for murein synthesis (MipA/OmpV family)
MKTFFALALLTTCGAATAQTPAINPMPDGSRDMYVGIGVQSTSRYEGAKDHKTRAVPVIQVQWSNGIFISGMSAGMHLSNQPTVEYGPLLTLQPRRSESGLGSTVLSTDALPGGVAGWVGPPSVQTITNKSGNRLAGMDPVSTRLLAGGFFNYYLSPQWRFTSSALYGAGNNRHGAIADLGVQRLAVDIAPHHAVALLGGVSLVNRDYNEAFFGVSVPEAVHSGNRWYSPGGGRKDVHVGLRWNWTLAPSWMLTSNLQAARLLGSAKDSPLVERPTNVTVSTALAYRF